MPAGATSAGLAQEVLPHVRCMRAGWFWCLTHVACSLCVCLADVNSGPSLSMATSRAARGVSILGVCDSSVRSSCAISIAHPVCPCRKMQARHDNKHENHNNSCNEPNTIYSITHGRHHRGPRPREYTVLEIRSDARGRGSDRMARPGRRGRAARADLPPPHGPRDVQNENSFFSKLSKYRTRIICSVGTY